MGIINLINDLLWTYILVALLLGCAVWFTLRTRFVQFRMIKEMVRLLGDSGGKGDAKEKHISSFQAFAISIASRVGTGNLAGVATAIAVGGPGAVFWMWVIALLGASSSFVESTLAQLYKIKGKDSFIGGPAYYMRKGLKQPWMGDTVCRTYHHYLRICIQLGTEQYTVCRFRRRFRVRPCRCGRDHHRTHADNHLWRRTAHSQSQQHHRAPSWRWDTLHWHLSSFC